MLPTESETLQQAIIRSAEKFKNNIAYQILQNDNTYKRHTYEQVYKNAQKIACFLQSKNIKPQSCIGIYAPNCPEWAIACLGILLNNNVVIPIDPKNGSVELSHTIKDADIDYVFASSRLAENLRDINIKGIVILDNPQTPPQLNTKNIYTLDEILKQKKTTYVPPSADPNDIAAIIYTSGTTSQPKGVMLTHRSIMFDIYAMLKVFPVDCKDSFLSVNVLSHVYELCCGLLLPLCIGASITYCKSIKYTTVFKNMALANPTVMYAVPEMYRMLLEHILLKVTSPRITDARKTPSEKPNIGPEAIQKTRKLLGGKLRFFVSGGAPLASSIIQDYKSLDVTLLQGYGLTESTSVMTITNPGDNKPRSAGKPLPGIEIKIEKMPGSQIGQICARGKNLMAGYHNNPAATKEAIKDGWLQTQDLGYLDDDGYIYITGRSKNMIVTSAGVNVFPEELESYITKSPFISEVCVVGKQKPDRTETVYAVIVPNDRYCKQYLAGLKKDSVENIPTLTEIIRKEIKKTTRQMAGFKKVHDFKIRTKKLPLGRTNKILREQVKHETFSLQGRFEIPHTTGDQPIALVNATIITPFRIAENECILIEDGTISQLAAKDKVYLPPNTKIIDLDGMMITPGFIDLHVHGAAGCSFNDTEKSSLQKISDFFLAHGTTHLLATLYLDEEKKLLDTISTLAAHCKQQQSIIYGIHLEGPFINKNMKGALNEEYILEPDIDQWIKLRKAGDGTIKMMTIAPELPGAAEVMQFAARDGVALAIAHSEAQYNDIEVAIDNGLSQVTHIFNAMHPIHHRNPGVLTGALLKRELKVHLIADGIHVHPAVMQLLYKLKGPEGIILITDAISATGTEGTGFNMAGKKVTVRNGIAITDNNTLAGSTVTLEKAIKIMVEKVGVPITEAVRMASLNPARVLGLDHKKGVLAVGKNADIVVLNKDFEVQMTIINGQIRYTKLKQP